MKPLKLTLRGINSYRTEQVIDFEKLTSAGLFGIFGPTGSGKSSILDAITLALYARLPRSTKNFININEKTAAISFLFSITTTETHRYLVERSFRYHGENENATVRNISGRLLEITEEAPVVLADRPTEVTQECVRLLGLTSDDFMRTVVLPQGQFSEFLKLKNADRRNMLQRIFHLEQYGLELTQKIAATRQKQDLLLSKLEGQLNLFEEISPEQLQQLTNQLNAAAKENEKLTVELQKAEASFKDADELHNLLLEYEPLKKSLEDSLKELPSVQKREQQVELSKKANQIRPFAEQAKKASHDHLQASHLLKESRDDLTQFYSKYQQLEAEKEKLQQEYTNKFPYYVAMEGKLQTAINQMTAIRSWNDKKELLKKSLEEQNILLETNKTKQNAILETGNRCRQDISRLETQAEQLQIPPDQLHALEKGHILEETYREKRRVYEINHQRFSEKQKQLRKDQTQLEQLCTNLYMLSGQATTLQQNLTEKMKRTHQQIANLQTTRQQISVEIENLQNENMASSLRNQLQEGIPCPVCGSIHHNLPGHQDPALGKDSSFGKSLQKKRERLDALENEEKQLLLQQNQLDQDNSLLKTSLHLIPCFQEETFCPVLPHQDSVLSTSETPKADTLYQNIQKAVSQYASARGAFLQRTEALSEEKQHLNEEYALLQNSAQHIMELRNQLQIDNFSLALNDKQKQEEEHKKLQLKIKELRQELDKNDAEYQIISETILKISQQISSLSSDMRNHETFIKEQWEKIPADLPQNADYSSLLIQLQAEKSSLEERKKQLDDQYQKYSQLLLQKKEQVSAADSREKSCASFEQEAAERLQSELEKQQFDPDTDLNNLYRSEKEIAEETFYLENFQNALRQTKDRLEYLDGKRADRSITTDEWQKEKEHYHDLQQQYERKRKEEILLSHQEELCRTQLAQKEKLQKEQDAAIHKRGLIRQLEQLFKGNAFVEYVAQSRLKYIASEASSILYSISNGNYALEVNEATEFIIRDNKNGGILRPCDTLSGGETFITSLSLALALSSVIQLNGTAPLELFFLDEGFGSLDDDLLDVVMTSLERLQNQRRSIGIITHVEAIQARVPVKLIVSPSNISQNGSTIRLEYS